MENCEKLNYCIACGSLNLAPVLDLGLQPLANSLKNYQDDLEEFFPLAINRCEECFHVQLTHIVNPDLLFKNYLYVSGTSKTQLEYFQWFAEYTLQDYENLYVENVLDIGCNDGSQLDAYKKLGLDTYGIDPAKNLYPLSSKNHLIRCEYFNEKTFDDGVTFDIITCQNAFAHNSAPLSFLKSVGKLMNRNSLLYITTSQSDMIFNNEFDTIYHEHISFYNIQSMNELCNRAGLKLIRAEKHPIHGSSYIFTISPYPKSSENVDDDILEEFARGLYSPEIYKKYTEKCQNIIENFGNTVERIRRNGYTVIGYGAAAKATTFLNASKVKLDFVIDENPLKIGKFIPGVSVPIYGLDYLDKFSEVDRVCFVILAWNFYTEIKTRIESKRSSKNDIYVKYFPEIIVENDDELFHHSV